MSFGRATQKGDRVYVQVFDWPADGKLIIPSLGKWIKGAYPLQAPSTRLKISEDSTGVSIDAAGVSPDRFATVIVLETARN